MRCAISSLAVLLLATLSFAAPQGSPVFGATSGKPGFLRLPLTYRKEVKFPTVDIGLGNPMQEVRVILNTGSSTLWVNPFCSLKGTCPERTFVNASSSTFNDLRREKTEQNLEEVSFGLATDKLTLGSVEINNQLFGVDNQWPSEIDYDEYSVWSLPYGLLGVGRPNASDPDSEKASVLRSLINGNHISTEAFSVDVKGPDGNGSVIFGGVDVKKYRGPLQTIPMLQNGKASYDLRLDGVNYSRPGQDPKTVSQEALSVHLMTGTPFSTLPYTVVKQVWESWRKKSPQSVDCDISALKDTLDFRFGDIVIKVPVKELLVARNLIIENCINNIWPLHETTWTSEGWTDTVYTLGNDILRHAYVVYDVKHSKIHLASSENCGSKVVALDDDTDYASLLGECPSSA